MGERERVRETEHTERTQREHTERLQANTQRKHREH